MNEQERHAVAAKLEASRERLLEVVANLTHEQWTFRPGEGRWSITECLEHVTNVENRVLGTIGKKLEGPSVPPGEQPTPRASDAEIAARVIDRTTRREAPEAVRPTGQWPDADATLEQFRAARSRTEQFVAGSTADLRSYFAPHGAFGEIDCYQWLLLLGGHAERHTMQMEEIKADSSFPRS